MCDDTILQFISVCAKSSIFKNKMLNSHKIFHLTLIYSKPADRAKAIKTTATVNESPTDKLIRELREENAKLMEMLKSGGITLDQLSAAGGNANQGKG